ncbi:Gfo/Idh/MocA family protein [Actinopolymorpha singaporensis]|uniref:Predicted dehydrogenase n=1 Tax=Actinopolymorpha singaporensis TaxID=117157 RepID=A0A1H1R090_9ACTN|nr:Gfo/Idh/MocA family oxidoreductase [Actinopolymorpha singaporensis]SDS29103.1 Predicted dehydrogenase [Actinopolymorpha singaporensis]
MVVAVGLAGAGRRAAGIHAPAIAGCPKVRLAGVWGRSPALIQNLAERTGTSAYTRYADFLRDCDAVAFAVPPAVQADLAVSTAHAGKALLLEKPLGGDLAGAEQVADAVATTRVVSQLALTWRYAVAVREFLTFTAPRARPQGGSGRVISGVLADPRWASLWQVERGVLRAYGTDLVDLLDAALGRVLAVRAHGDPGGWVGIMLEHEGGHFSEASLYAHIEHRADGHAHVSNRAEVEVFGPGGAADVDCLTGVDQDAFKTMYDEFATAVENHASPELDVRRGLHLQQVLDNAETDLLRQV